MKNDVLGNNIEFLDQVGIEQIVHMFDLIPDTLFWIKNRKSQIVYANRAYLNTYSIKHMQSIVGKTDEFFTPPRLAKQFIIDDKKVMAGELVTNRIELNFDREGNFAWYSTTKRPLFDEHKNIVGSYGFAQHLERSSEDLSTISAIRAPVEFIRENFHTDICI